MVQATNKAVNRRRGVVLILVLAMLSIMALIGVTFASLSGQAQVGARYFAEGRDATTPETYFDYALNQLINDTNNPKSALRGHSLLRDMYGHPDPVLDVVTGQPIGRRGGYLPRLPEPLNTPLTFTGVAFDPATRVYTVSTNIPTRNNPAIGQVPSLYGANFTGWVLRLQQWAFDAAGNGRQLVPPVGQTFEVMADDYSGAFHVFRLSPADVTTPGLVLPDSPLVSGLPPGFTTWANVFELDGRYLGAFNGTGMSMVGMPNAIAPDRVNFLYNNPVIPGGFYDPDAFDPQAPLNPALSSPSMDEDYDAVDHENMFLAWQSADGEVMIPSFHRPNQIVYDPDNTGVNDWENPPDPVQANLRRAKFLRPRRADHPQSGETFPDLVPDRATGKITYDVDNDGDGVTDSVWIDLGYPVQRSKEGRLFKPLFSFMVIGLNGRIPLNSAGNLQRRAMANLDKDGNGVIDVRLNGNGQVDLFLSDAYAGWPLVRHASHLGYSPFEVNPAYGLTTPLGQDGPNLYELNRNRDGQQLLLQLLTGVNDPTLGWVPGRYGEVEVFALAAQSGYVGRFPGAGRSYNLNPLATDLMDSNFNAFDFFPAVPEAGDLLDLAGRQMLPVERMRHFLTPIDLTGSGLIVPWDTMPQPQGDFGRGADRMGRVSYFQYYRPAGVASGALPPDRDMNGSLEGERIYDPALLPNEVPGLNVLHGYESHRNPAGRPGQPGEVPAREFMARAPFNVGDNRTLPTFDGQINSANPIVQSPPAAAPPPPFTIPTQIVQGMYPNGSLGLNEDIQLNLYRREPYDEIFGPEDLEWLYRLQDVDGTSLTSRLEHLAQVVTQTGEPFRAFVDDDPVTDLATGARLGIDALTRRRLYAVDSWELNRFAWMQNYFTPGNAPALGHGNRKINLNYPLPLSYDSSEPTRLKWISEAYALMKQVLYPGFVPPGTGAPGEPRPEDFARLGQFAVNIIDFRDPDDVMTRWVNPDLKLRPAEGFGYDDGDSVPNEPAGVAWINDPTVPNTGQGTGPVVQWGMEYLPVTINEVLAYQFQAKDGNEQRTVKRLFVEFANILTEDGDGIEGQGGRASDLYLRGWGLLITPDDPTANPGLPQLRGERPNTATGQLDPDTLKEVIPLAGSKGDPPTFNPLPRPVEALDSGDDDVDALPNQNGPGNDNHYLMANRQPIANAEQNPPNPDAELSDDLVAQLPTLPVGSGEARYYWLHLVRPANPHAANLANEPLVVVDSFRFPYRDAGIRVDASNPNDEVTVPAYPPGTNPPAASTRAIYSVGRHQPLRGGHAVPDSHRYSPPYPYGWSEQTAADRGSNAGDNDPPDIRGRYPINVMGNPVLTPVTAPIHHTLGYDNRLESGGSSPRENWDHFPFLDRDFASVTELLLVPDCPPGLFTKKFAERAGLPDPADAGDGFPGPYPHATPPEVFESGMAAAVATGGVLDWPPYLVDPHPFPYLPQRFYYTAVPLEPGPPPVPSHDRAGWFQFFEFFEVPSPVAGAIGPVAEGDNLDWLRKDVRPGALNLNLIIDEEAFFALVDDPRLNLNPLASGASVPRVVTAIDPNGQPTFSHPMSDLNQYTLGRGFHAPAGTPPGTYMKSAFADFVKLRHGGSGLIGLSPLHPLAPKPFRSATAVSPVAGLDVYDTVFRPARLEAFDPNLGVMPDRTSIPPRRLFQVADRYDEAQPLTLIDPASELGNFPGQPPLTPNHTQLANPTANLFGSATAPPDWTLGSAEGADRRRHPLWQGEMIQKVMNNATVRTHQFAVWVTVGFFEVVREGNPSKVMIDPRLAVDELGKEIGRDTGQQVRYRAFFVVDRTRATRFDPRNPEDFRNLIVYRRTIQ
ncbi:MAG: hypothetical protein KatS3mg108_0943 [Isosphaeraceae bacterium]|nr:MAG: hypothetical protein KatS3mg108_0943 [Isosphaeraceae bacterium]